MSRRRLEE
ncbi:hypothetical protein IEO21_08358 [Rhodonia placenta]|uniref:Uncharacterized protein n=1 Tax=Rhodonia placenta TaxID=104341 RepID=A0A8H7NWJ8_9APHY|nr:hypothetical protein IEO21_08358 [Postia placenta]